MIPNNANIQYNQVSEKEERLGVHIIDIAVCIHKVLDPGLLESIYEKCFCYELSKRGIAFERQKVVSLKYDQLVIDEGLRIDLLVDDLVVVELKAQVYYHPVWEAQVLSYLKLSNKRLGYILNFNVSLMKEGMKRMIV